MKGKTLTLEGEVTRIPSILPKKWEQDNGERNDEYIKTDDQGDHAAQAAL